MTLGFALSSRAKHATAATYCKPWNKNG